MSAGKGDSPRHNLKKFQEGYDGINFNKGDKNMATTGNLTNFAIGGMIFESSPEGSRTLGRPLVRTEVFEAPIRFSELDEAFFEELAAEPSFDLAMTVYTPPHTLRSKKKRLKKKWQKRFTRKIEMPARFIQIDTSAPANTAALTFEVERRYLKKETK